MEDTTSAGVVAACVVGTGAALDRGTVSEVPPNKLDAEAEGAELPNKADAELLPMLACSVSELLGSTLAVVVAEAALSPAGLLDVIFVVFAASGTEMLSAVATGGGVSPEPPNSDVVDFSGSEDLANDDEDVTARGVTGSMLTVDCGSLMPVISEPTVAAGVA